MQQIYATTHVLYLQGSNEHIFWTSWLTLKIRKPSTRAQHKLIFKQYRWEHFQRLIRQNNWLGKLHNSGGSRKLWCLRPNTDQTWENCVPFPFDKYPVYHFEVLVQSQMLNFKSNSAGIHCLYSRGGAFHNYPVKWKNIRLAVLTFE
jgi:hypothetical protein